MPLAIGGVAALASTGMAVNNMVNQPSAQFAGAGGGNPYIYQPQFQPGADVNYNNLAGMQYGTAMNLTPQLVGGYTQNPYASGYMTAAGQAGPMATATGMNAGVGAQNMQQYAQMIQPYIGGTLQQGYNTNPYRQYMVDQAGAAANYATNAGQIATGAGANAINTVPAIYTAGRQAIAEAPGMFDAAKIALGAGNQILGAGFDPQQALYNRTQQRVADQANAINAQYGMQSSPYGAGVAGQTMSNFNIDWQNAQLAREMQALQGYGAASGAAQGDVASGVGALRTGAGLYGEGANVASQGLGMLGQGVGFTREAGQLPYGAYQQGFITDPLAAQGQAGQNFGNLLRNAGVGYTGALDLGSQGANQLLAGGQIPYNAYMNYLGGMNQGVQSAYGLPQQLGADYLNYMGRGSSAGNLALSAQQQGFAQQLASMQQAGQGLGILAGLFPQQPPQPEPYINYNSLPGNTSYTSNANDNFGYPGFDFAQAG